MNVDKRNSIEGRQPVFKVKKDFTEKNFEIYPESNSKSKNESGCI